MSDNVYRDMVVAMVTGVDSTGEFDMAAINKIGKFNRHGNYTRDGEDVWELEFNSVIDAVAWYTTWGAHVAYFEIRAGDVVAGLRSSVVCEVIL